MNGAGREERREIFFVVLLYEDFPGGAIGAIGANFSL